jgi:hypothetical protein
MDAALFLAAPACGRRVGDGFYMKDLKGKSDSANTVCMGIKQHV